MNIWHFSEQVSGRLLSWNLVNILIGLLLLPRKSFWRGLGSQAVGWGLINSAIAIVGNEATRHRRLKLDDAHTAPRLSKEARNLRLILWINTALDVLYMVGGWLMFRSARRGDGVKRGAGIGIMVQGALLFIFDLIHARIVPDAPALEQDKRA
jgi:hypothetical protein